MNKSQIRLEMNNTRWCRRILFFRRDEKRDFKCPDMWHEDFSVYVIPQRVKVKVKVTLVQALRLCTDLRPIGGSRGIALPFNDQGTRRGWGGQRHAPAAFYPRERSGTHCTGGWMGPRCQSGQVRKISPPTGIRSSDRPACRQSLYWLSYRANPQRVIFYETVELLHNELFF